MSDPVRTLNYRISKPVKTLKLLDFQLLDIRFIVQNPTRGMSYQIKLQLVGYSIQSSILTPDHSIDIRSSHTLTRIISDPVCISTHCLAGPAKLQLQIRDV